ncbi:hypothetical protein [Nocardia xishanensis]|uniref:Transposase n=1 Tax=Nocardia xishanensis TaxID=238964 RepID=A0ABW7X7G2_9NOCA
MDDGSRREGEDLVVEHAPRTGRPESEDRWAVDDLLVRKHLLMSEDSGVNWCCGSARLHDERVFRFRRRDEDRCFHRSERRRLLAALPAVSGLLERR